MLFICGDDLKDRQSQHQAGHGAEATERIDAAQDGCEDRIYANEHALAIDRRVAGGRWTSCGALSMILLR
jgi:hypothetical protein